MTCGIAPRKQISIHAASADFFKTIAALTAMVFLFVCFSDAGERPAKDRGTEARTGYRVLTLLYRSDTAGFDSEGPSWWNTREASGDGLADPSADAGNYSPESVVTGAMRRVQNATKDCLTIHAGNLVNFLTLPSQVLGIAADLGIAALARYDVFSPGASDFGVPALELLQQSGRSGLIVVLSNLVDKFTGQTVFTDRFLKNFGRFKVGVFSILLPGAVEKIPRGHLGGAILADPATAARKMVYLLRRDGADIVIGIYHGSIDEVLALSAAIGSVDMVVCGGSGRNFESPVLTTGCPVLASSGPTGFGKAVINVRDGRMTSLDNTIEISDHAGRGDGTVDTVVKILRARTRALSGATLAKVYARLGTGEEDDGQTPASRVLSHALLRGLGVQVTAWTAGLLPGAIDRGTVTVADLARLLPEDRRIVIFEARGSAIAETIDVSFHGEGPPESRLRFGGVTFDVVGDMIRNKRINGFRLEENRRYLVAAPEPTNLEKSAFPVFLGRWQSEGQGWVSDTTLRRIMAWHLKLVGEF